MGTITTKVDDYTAFLVHLAQADSTITRLLKDTQFLKVEDFHDLSYIRERLQILRREQEKHAASRTGKEERV